MNKAARDFLKYEFRYSIVNDALGDEGADQWADDIMNEIEKIMGKPNTVVVQPTVGRIVHYHLDSNIYAAIVTDVPDLLSEGPNYGPEGYVKAVSLKAFSPNGEMTLHNVPYSEDKVRGSWSWPSRS